MQQSETLENINGTSASSKNNRNEEEKKQVCHQSGSGAPKQSEDPRGEKSAANSSLQHTSQHQNESQLDHHHTSVHANNLTNQLHAREIQRMYENVRISQDSDISNLIGVGNGLQDGSNKVIHSNTVDRRTVNRRDNYLSNLVAKRAGQKTNVLSKFIRNQQQQSVVDPQTISSSGNAAASLLVQQTPLIGGYEIQKNAKGQWTSVPKNNKLNIVTELHKNYEQAQASKSQISSLGFAMEQKKVSRVQLNQQEMNLLRQSIDYNNQGMKTTTMGGNFQSVKDRQSIQKSNVENTSVALSSAQDFIHLDPMHLQKTMMQDLNLKNGQGKRDQMVTRINIDVATKTPNEQTQLLSSQDSNPNSTQLQIQGPIGKSGLQTSKFGVIAARQRSGSNSPIHSQGGEIQTKKFSVTNDPQNQTQAIMIELRKAKVNTGIHRREDGSDLSGYMNLTPRNFKQASSKTGERNIIVERTETDLQTESVIFDPKMSQMLDKRHQSSSLQQSQEFGVNALLPQLSNKVQVDHQIAQTRKDIQTTGKELTNFLRNPKIALEKQQLLPLRPLRKRESLINELEYLKKDKSHRRRAEQISNSVEITAHLKSRQAPLRQSLLVQSAQKPFLYKNRNKLANFEEQISNMTTDFKMVRNQELFDQLDKKQKIELLKKSKMPAQFSASKNAEKSLLKLRNQQRMQSSEAGERSPQTLPSSSSNQRRSHMRYNSNTDAQNTEMSPPADYPIYQTEEVLKPPGLIFSEPKQFKLGLRGSQKFRQNTKKSNQSLHSRNQYKAVTVSSVDFSTLKRPNQINSPIQFQSIGSTKHDNIVSPVNLNSTNFNSFQGNPLENQSLYNDHHLSGSHSTERLFALDKLQQQQSSIVMGSSQVVGTTMSPSSHQEQIKTTNSVAEKYQQTSLDQTPLKLIEDSRQQVIIASSSAQNNAAAPTVRQNNVSWIHRGPALQHNPSSEDLNRGRRRLNDQLNQELREVENQVRQKRKQRDQMIKLCQERQVRLNQERHLTERIQQFDRAQRENIQKLNSSLEMHNQSIWTDTSDSVFMQQSSLEVSREQSDIYSLYKKRIVNDLQTTKRRTEGQVEFERSQIGLSFQQVEALAEENKGLKRAIKRTKEVLEEAQLKKQKKERQQKDKLNNGGAGAGNGKPSDDGQSSQQFEVTSFGSISQIGGASKVKIGRIQSINNNLVNVVRAKTAVDAVLVFIKTMKDAFKNLARLSVHILDRHLQKQMFHNNQKYSRNFKMIQFSKKKVIYSVFDLPIEQCKPCYTSVQQAMKPIFQQRLIHIPVIFDSALIFTIQMESEMPVGAQLSIGGNKKVENQLSSVARQNTRSQNSESRMSKNRSDSKSKRVNQLKRALWGHSDYTLCKIIGQMLKVRTQVFVAERQKIQKAAFKGQVLQFIKEYIRQDTYKSVICKIKEDLPKLFGYEEVEVMLHDPPTQTLYCMNVNLGAPETEEEKQMTDFERSYVIKESQIVRFPCNMGISGYAFQNDAVLYINDFYEKQEDVSRKLTPTMGSLRDKCYGPIFKALFGDSVCSKVNYNDKIDNFIQNEAIDSVLFCSMRDEEIIGSVCPTGILQFYNRVHSDITKEDVKRMHYLRKLIGTMFIEQELKQMALETILGFVMNSDIQRQMVSQIEQVENQLVNSVMYTIKANLQQAQKKIDDRYFSNGTADRLQGMELKKVADNEKNNEEQDQFESA